MNNIELVQDLCAVSPSLREARRVHLGSFGALIPHVFMGEVLARIGACMARERGAQPPDMPELLLILAALERGLNSGDRETRNVVAISFARDSELEPFFHELKPLLGPGLRAQLQGR